MLHHHALKFLLSEFKLFFFFFQKKGKNDKKIVKRKRPQRDKTCKGMNCKLSHKDSIPVTEILHP